MSPSWRSSSGPEYESSPHREEGACGTCENPVLEGVPDHRDRLLTDEEEASGDVMLICVSGALADRLVLEL
ncbi:2Fe-2S iron-sulfur cluster-binding protein [Streptomyces formicae]|uniref:2Fe-2S iron-sulfur cluster-binding protein n=1 Tax=Streptomyces formicae TaxID=1616117 RepID=UPI00362065E0